MLRRLANAVMKSPAKIVGGVAAAAAAGISGEGELRSESSSKKHRVKHASVRDEQAPPSTDKTERYVQVHIWRTDGEAGRCGHSGISLHAKTGEYEDHEYAALWPKTGILSNPFTYLLGSVRGKIHKDRQDCAAIEGDQEAMDPHVVYKITISEEQFRELKNQMAGDKADRKEGYLRYSLTPKVNLTALVKILADESVLRSAMDPDFLEEHPEVVESAEKVSQIRFEHCTTFAHNYLTLLGLPVKKSRLLPWQLAPSQLDDQLNDLSRGDAGISSFESTRHPIEEEQITE